MTIIIIWVTAGTNLVGSGVGLLSLQSVDGRILLIHHHQTLPIPTSQLPRHFIEHSLVVFCFYSSLSFDLFTFGFRTLHTLNPHSESRRPLGHSLCSRCSKQAGDFLRTDHFLIYEDCRIRTFWSLGHDTVVLGLSSFRIETSKTCRPAAALV